MMRMIEINLRRGLKPLLLIKHPPSLVIKPPASLVIKFLTAKIRLMKPTQTKAEIDALEQELQEQREKQIKRVHRAVNPGR